MNENIKNENIDNSRLWQAGGIVIVLAVIANLIIGFLTKAIVPISPEFMPLNTMQYTIFTIIGMVGAVILYAVLVKRSKTPVTTFQRIAWIFLIVSMIPDILLLVSDAIPGTTVAGVVSLMIMHLAPGLIAIYGLPRLTRIQQGN